MKKILLSICSLLLVLTLISCNSSDNYKLKTAASPISTSYNDIKDLNIEQFIDKLDVFSAKLTVSLYKNSDKKTTEFISVVFYFNKFLRYLYP